MTAFIGAFEALLFAFLGNIVDWLSVVPPGELVTMLGGHPSLKIGALLETEKHDIGDILRESLEHEKKAGQCYCKLLKLVEGNSVVLEEYAREMIYQEELHLDEVNKMLRKPGDLTPFKN